MNIHSKLGRQRSLLNHHASTVRVLALAYQARGLRFLKYLALKKIFIMQNYAAGRLLISNIQNVHSNHLRFSVSLSSNHIRRYQKALARSYGALQKAGLAVAQLT